MLKEALTKDCVITWDKFEQDSKLLAHKLANRKWKGMIALTRGGLIPAGMLAYHLNILHVDTFCISTYNDRSQSSVNIIKRSIIDNDGEGWLAVDDLADTGKTLRIIQKTYPKIHLATLYAKPMGKNLPHTYVEDFDQNYWIVFPWD